MTEEVRKKYQKEWYSKNKERALADAKAYREKNKDRILEYQRSERILKYKTDYRRENREKLNAYQKAWRIENKEKVAAYYKKHEDANKEKITARGALWGRTHRKEISAREKKRKREDLNFSIKKRLKSRVWHSVNRQSGKKAKRTMELLGCSIASFRIYIESKFEPGMTWDNIHLDHIIPCALFDLTKPGHQKICFHFSNYQPLFVKDNLEKGSRIPDGVILPEEICAP